MDPSATSVKITLIPAEESRVGYKPLEKEQEDCQSIKDYTFYFDNNLTNGYFEYEQGQKDIIVKGRLKEHINFWKHTLKANSFYTDRSKAVLLLWFLTVICSCCPYLYFGSAIMLETYFSKF